MPHSLPVIVIGGSLAGLATASLLRAKDIPTIVLESTDSIGAGDDCLPAWVLKSHETTIASFRADAGLPARAATKLQLKVSADRVGTLATGTVAFVMKTEAASMFARISARANLSASELASNRLEEFLHEKVAVDVRPLLLALAGPDGAEQRSSPRGVFALARDLVMAQEEIVAFEGGCGPWIDECASKAGDVRLNCKVERLLLEPGHARGVKLADGRELEASAVVMALPATEARALFTDEDWQKVSAEERWKFEAANPRPALRLQFELTKPSSAPTFVFCESPSAHLIAIGSRAWAVVGAAVDAHLDTNQQNDLARQTVGAFSKLGITVSTSPDMCKMHFAPLDEPVGLMSGGRERPHHMIDGFDNLLIAGAAADAPGYGLDRTVGSARIAARKI
ncbi:MAG: FAD-dependent oxidoreductase [Planctomycetes bacterium]|nr:FAD-dependent oxidoreductase [Planctomycetota bacterium]